MKYIISLLGAVLVIGTANAGTQFIDGYYFGAAKNTIQYKGVGYTGQYDETTNMDETSCIVSSKKYSFSGSLAPLDEELSCHIRGPIIMKNMAVFYASNSSNGQSSAKQWSRTGYYDSDSSTRDRLTFMNRMAGEGTSGTWSTCFGPSLSFAAADGVSPATSPMCLSPNTYLPSNKEISVWAGNKCSGTDCGFSYGGISYHGFGGADKAFIFNVRMPYDTKCAGAMCNMPSIWFLNSKIPRTLEYPIKPHDSCRFSGCGELDVFAVLGPDCKDYMTSHIYTNQGFNSSNYGGVGTPDYIMRPVDSFKDYAVIMRSDQTITICVAKNFDWTKTVYSSNDLMGLCDQSSMTTVNMPQ